MKVIFNYVEEGSKHAWFKLSEVEGLESGAFETHSVLDLSDDWVLAQEVHHPDRQQAREDQLPSLTVQT